MPFAGFPHIAFPIDTLSNDAPGQTLVRYNSDGTAFKVVRACNNTGSACVSGQPYLLRYDGDEETNPGVIDPATATTAINYVVFATAATANGAFGWFTCFGYMDVLIDGTTNVAKDDYLEVVNGGTSLIKDAAALSLNSCAIACAAQETDAAVITRVFVLGERVNVQAS